MGKITLRDLNQKLKTGFDIFSKPIINAVKEIMYLTEKRNNGFKRYVVSTFEDGSVILIIVDFSEEKEEEEENDYDVEDIIKSFPHFNLRFPGSSVVNKMISYRNHTGLYLIVADSNGAHIYNLSQHPTAWRTLISGIHVWHLLLATDETKKDLLIAIPLIIKINDDKGFSTYNLEDATERFYSRSHAYWYSGRAMTVHFNWEIDALNLYVCQGNPVVLIGYDDYRIEQRHLKLSQGYPSKLIASDVPGSGGSWNDFPMEIQFMEGSLFFSQARFGMNPVVAFESGAVRMMDQASYILSTPSHLEELFFKEVENIILEDNKIHLFEDTQAGYCWIANAYAIIEFYGRPQSQSPPHRLCEAASSLTVLDDCCRYEDQGYLGLSERCRSLATIENLSKILSKYLQISSFFLPNPVSFTKLKNELDNNHPIIIVVQYYNHHTKKLVPNTGQTMLIQGYRKDCDSNVSTNESLLVYDPTKQSLWTKPVWMKYDELFFFVKEELFGELYYYKWVATILTSPPIST